MERRGPLVVSWLPAGQHGVDDGGDGGRRLRTTGRLTGDNAVIIAGAGAHFGTVGGAKQHKYCELRGPQPADHLLQATQGAIQGVNNHGA